MLINSFFFFICFRVYASSDYQTRGNLLYFQLHMKSRFHPAGYREVLVTKPMKAHINGLYPEFRLGKGSQSASHSFFLHFLKVITEPLWLHHYMILTLFAGTWHKNALSLDCFHIWSFNLQQHESRENFATLLIERERERVRQTDRQTDSLRQTDIERQKVFTCTCILQIKTILGLCLFRTKFRQIMISLSSVIFFFSIYRISYYAGTQALLS